MLDDMNNGGSCYWALWTMPPLKNKLKKETMLVIYKSEKNVNCHIPACFTRHSEAQDAISSPFFLDLGLVHKHLIKK